MMEFSQPLNRREFCRTIVWGVPSLIIGLGNMLPVTRIRPEDEKPSGIVQLRLHAHRLDELRSFYHQLFHFPIKEETKNSITFQAGSTLLTFELTAQDDQPFYHFAFNIPENKLELAKTWLTQRVSLATKDGREVYHFANWNAHSIYYWDPAGNLGELIARHDLPNARSGPFADEDILYASEIGLVVEEVPDTVHWANEKLRWSPYRQPADNFAAIGDEHQLLIVAKKLRPWMSKPAQIFPTMVTLRGEKAQIFAVSNYPYKIGLQPKS